MATLEEIERRLADMSLRMDTIERRNTSDLNHINRKLHEVDNTVATGVITIDKMDKKLDSIQELLDAWNSTKGFVKTVNWLSKLFRIVYLILAIIAAVYLWGKTGQWKSPF